MPKAPKKPRYSPHPMLVRERAQMEKLRDDTGKSFEQWCVVARKSGVEKPAELTAWLVREYGIPKMCAGWIAWASRGNDPTNYGDPEPLVDALYSGAKAALRPVHEAAVDAALALGDDVVVTACKTMVPVYRKHVFAELRPVAAKDGAAVEVLLALGDRPAGGRVVDVSARTPGDRTTHRVMLRSMSDVDAEFRALLAEAWRNGAASMSRGKTDLAVPPDLAKHVAKGAAAKTWESMTPAMRRDMIQWVEQAKQAETRARRVATCASKLAEGKKRVY
ncbi:MAG: hypothetical protein HMLKMBBP_02641 [Planctomycetes bacterium]|nr:hypothetical protein [Planctomycetota bacterium]